jgi:hypothetical protein
MAISEGSRHALYQRLEEVLGRDNAETLMEHLPPVGWADVATKRDLDALTVATKRDLENLENRLIARMDQAFHAQAWRLAYGMIGNSLVVASAVIAAVKL